MSVRDLVSPISLSNGDHVELSVGDSSLDGSLDFLSNLPAETNVSVGVTNDDETFKSGSLTSASLLLDRGDLENFFRKLVLRISGEEVVNNFRLLDGCSELEDVIEGSDLSVLDESSELGGGLPVSLVT